MICELETNGLALLSDLLGGSDGQGRVGASTCESIVCDGIEDFSSLLDEEFLPKAAKRKAATRTKTKTRMKTAMTSTTTKMRTKKKKTKSMRTSTRMKRMMTTKKRMTTRTRKKRTTTSTTPTMMTTTTITKTRNSKTTMNRTAYDNRSCTIFSNSKRMVSSSWWMESWWKSRRVHWQARRLVSFQQRWCTFECDECRRRLPRTKFSMFFP